MRWVFATLPPNPPEVRGAPPLPCAARLPYPGRRGGTPIESTRSQWALPRRSAVLEQVCAGRLVCIRRICNHAAVLERAAVERLAAMHEKGWLIVRLRSKLNAREARSKLPEGEPADAPVELQIRVGRRLPASMKRYPVARRTRGTKTWVPNCALGTAPFSGSGSQPLALY